MRHAYDKALDIATQLMVAQLQGADIGNTIDAQAILCALPLIEQIPTDSPGQDMRNSIALNSASGKLLAMIENSTSPAQKSSDAARLTAEDIRIMFCAIGFALDFLSGQDFGRTFQVDDEWKADLFRHLFTLNRLYPIFDSLVTKIEAVK